MKSLFIPLFNFESFTQMVSYLGAIQGFILAVIVWNYPQQHKTSNRLLSLFLLTIVYLFLSPQLLGFIESPYKGLYFGFRTLSGVFLILYIQSLYRKVLLKKYKRLFLIIPLDIIVIYSIIHYGIVADGTFIDSGVLSQLWFVCLLIFFTPFIYFQYEAYKRKVYQNLSSVKRIGLKWVAQLVFGFLFLIVFDFVLSLLANNLFILDSKIARFISIVAFTVYMYFITIKGKLSPQIYKLRNLEDYPDIPTSIQVAGKVNQEKNEELNALSQQVVSCIEEQKLYKEMGLTINDIAEKIEVQPYLVSQAINVCLGKNFFELINRYRVEEAKNMLADASWNHLSIVGIGFEAGFNSKTTFNTTFKKYVGMTPSEYKREELKKTG